MIVCLSGVPKSMIKSLESECGYAVYVPQRKLFPDGEQYLRIELRGASNSVVVTQSLYPEQDRKIVELYLALEALQGLNVRVDTVVLPYAAYTRQDKRFLFGEPISTKALYNALKIFGVTRIVTVDVHSSRPFNDMGYTHIDLLPHSYMISRSNMEIDMVLAPDKGAFHRALDVAKQLGVEYDYLDKYRDRITGEITIDTKTLDVAGRDIAIVDDIISTGKTLAKATEALYRAGASNVYAVVSHAFISRETIDILSKAGLKSLVIANTIELSIDLPSWIKVIDITPIICRALKSG